MMTIIFVALLMSGMMALTASLQTTAAWWKGPAAAVLLFLIGIGNAVVLSIDPGVQANQIAIMLSVTAWICGAIIGLGALLSLVLRNSMAPQRVTGLTFGIGFIVIFLSWFAAALP